MNLRRRAQCLRTPVLAILALSFSASGALAQPRGRPDLREAAPEQIDAVEGERVLAAFRGARTKGDFSFSFEMVSRVRGEKPETSYGRMLGTWDEAGYPLTRVELSLPEGHTLRLIYRGGPEGTILKALDGAPAQVVTGPALFEPLLPGFTFTPFEMQMPFLHWEDHVYEGTKKLQDRAAHYFLLRPPAGAQTGDVAAVRVAVDADFLVMLLAEELDGDGATIKEFRINGFAKVDGQWIVKEIDLVNKKTKDRTRFRVDDALVDLTLPKSYFQAEPGQPVAPLPVTGNSPLRESGD
jgi:hypothetical protein